jgi:hypothetical protein
MASAPRSLRNVAIWTCRLPSSTVTFGQTMSRSWSLETTRLRLSISAMSRSNARAPIFAGSPSITSRRRAGSTTILPKLCWKGSSMRASSLRAIRLLAPSILPQHRAASKPPNVSQRQISDLLRLVLSHLKDNSAGPGDPLYFETRLAPRCFEDRPARRLGAKRRMSP